MGYGGYYAAFLACSLITGCSSPTAPSPASPISPAVPAAAFIIDGDWAGTYRVARAEPANCGVVTGCGERPPATLSIKSDGEALTGVLNLGIAGRFDVKGRYLNRSDVVLTSDPVAVDIRCSGRPTQSGESVLVSWSASLVGGKSLIGSFRSQQFKIFNVGGANLCPAGYLTVDGIELDLKRVPPG